MLNTSSEKRINFPFFSGNLNLQKIMEVKKRKMQKRTSLTLLLVCLLLTMSFVSLSYATQGTATLYAHSEGITADETAYKALNTSACDGPEDKIELESTADGQIVALGNSSVIAVNSLESYIRKLKTATWTFSYYAIANVTEKTTLLCNVTLLYENGTTKASLAGFKAETSVLTESNATYTATVSITEAVVSSTDYLRIIWFANKTDATALKITLWLDVTATPTKITGVSYEYPGSAYWDSAVRTIFQILLPLMFIIGASVKFVAVDKRLPTITEIIIILIAFLLLVIMTPIALDILYSA